jgi:hypothetical protein
MMTRLVQKVCLMRICLTILAAIIVTGGRVSGQGAIQINGEDVTATAAEMSESLSSAGRAGQHDRHSKPG